MPRRFLVFFWFFLFTLSAQEENTSKWKGMSEQVCSLLEKFLEWQQLLVGLCSGSALVAKKENNFSHFQKLPLLYSELAFLAQAVLPVTSQPRRAQHMSPSL